MLNSRPRGEILGGAPFFVGLGGEDVHVFVVGRERFRRQSRPYRAHSCFVRLRRVEALRWAISPRRGLEICARRAAKMRSPGIGRRRNEGRNAFAPPWSRMKCGTNITPCGETPLGLRPQKNTRLKSATAPRERRAARRRTPREVAPFRRGACAGFPQARASRRAWGYACFAPSGRILKFPSADFEGKRDA